MQYLVTGTGRCGTVYMARLLTSLGIMCGHEAVFDHYGLDAALDRLNGLSPLTTSHCSTVDEQTKKNLNPWFDATLLKAESSYMAAPYLAHDCLKDVKIIHAIRDPLKVLTSHIKDVKFFDLNNNGFLVWKNFVFAKLPELKKINNIIERGCYYYIHWNKMIAASTQPYLLHKVEKGCTASLLNFLNIKEMPENVFQDTKINSWAKKRVDLKLTDIPNGSIKKEFMDMMLQYGYFKRIY